MDPREELNIRRQLKSGNLAPRQELEARRRIKGVTTAPKAEGQPVGEAISKGGIEQAILDQSAIPLDGAEGPSLLGSGLVQPLIKGKRSSPISPFVAALDRGIADAGEGVQQLGLEALNKMGLVKDQTLQDFNKTTQGDIDAFRGIEQANPIAANTGRILGGMGATAAIPGGSTIKGAAGVGALLGGTQFVSEGGNRLKNMAIGGATGGTLSAALKGIGVVGAKGINTLKGKLSPQAEEINKLGKQFDIKTSVGDITGQPLIQKTEVLAENVPVIGFAGFRDSQQKQVARAAGDLVDGFSVNGDWASILQTSLKDKAAAVRGTAGKLFNKVSNLADPLGVVPASKMNQAANKILKEELAKVPEFQDPALIKAIQRYTVDPKANFTGLQSIRSDLGDDIADFFTGKNAIVGKKGVGKLQAIKKAIDADMEDFAAQRGGQINIAFKRANKFWRERVVPFKDRAIATAAESDVPDEIFKKFVKRDGRDRAVKFFNALDKKGKEAVRFGILENAFQAASPVDKPFSAARFAQALEQFDAPASVFFKGPERAQLQGFDKLLRHVQRSGQFAENPPTGQRLILLLLTGGTIASPATGAGVGGTAAGVRLLFGTEAGKRLLLSANRMGAGTQSMQRAIENFTARAGALASSTPPPTGSQQPRPR